MKIGMDAREIQKGVYTGIGRALYDLIRYVENNPGEDEIVLFAAQPLPFSFTGRVQVRIIPEKWTFGWDQLVLAFALRREQVDVFYSPYYKAPLFAPCPVVTAVLDLMYLEYPPYRQKIPVLAWLYYQVFGRWYAGVSSKVHTCSQFSCEDIVRVYGVPRKKIAVIPLTVSSGYSPGEVVDIERVAAMRKTFGIINPYILYTGNFKEHKNVPALIEAFSSLASDFPALDLVLVGPRPSDHLAWMNMFREHGIEGRVIFTDKVANEDLGRLLYVGAEVFVMPSLYEGFGLPPVEAMACGTPVVCSKAASLPEVVGDAAILVDAQRPYAIAAAVGRLLTDKDLRQELIRKGLCQVEQFRAQRIMPRMLALLREAAR